MIIIVGAALLLGALAPRTYASGTPLKGAVLGTRPVQALTGDCTCEQQWFTFGATPGKVRLSASMFKPGQELSNEYAIRVSILRGGASMGLKAVLCFTNQKQCSNTLHLSVTIRQRGVYYVLVRGMGAHQVPFQLRLKGSVYQLHCTRTC
jgi:hypothetical protein